MTKTKRLVVAIITGAILGIFCIIGVSLRLGCEGNEIFILATYFNRLILGVVIGIAAYIPLKKTKLNIFIRGSLVGLMISLSFYLATEFYDLPGFIAGVFYGVIIDFVATKFE